MRKHCWTQNPYIGRIDCVKISKGEKRTWHKQMERSTNDWRVIKQVYAFSLTIKQKVFFIDSWSSGTSEWPHRLIALLTYRQLNFSQIQYPQTFIMSKYLRENMIKTRRRQKWMHNELSGFACEMPASLVSCWEFASVLRSIECVVCGRTRKRPKGEQSSQCG